MPPISRGPTASGRYGTEVFDLFMGMCNNESRLASFLARVVEAFTQGTIDEAALPC